jgi:hypothetical protein
MSGPAVGIRSSRFSDDIGSADETRKEAEQNSRFTEQTQTSHYLALMDVPSSVSSSVCATPLRFNIIHAVTRHMQIPEDLLEVSRSSSGRPILGGSSLGKLPRESKRHRNLSSHTV